jgi:tetratricopeptide (TPR) repeat protein
MTLRRKVQGPEHPEMPEAMTILANSLEGAGRSSEALKLREEVLPLSRKVLGPDHPVTLESLQQLAISYAKAGRRDEALKVQESLLAALQQRVTHYPAEQAAANQAATIHLSLGKTNEYQILCQKLLAAAAGSQDPEVHDQAARPCLLWSQPDPDTLKLAVASARRALALAKPGDGSMPQIQLTVGLAAYREGKLGEAETLLSEALKSATNPDDRGLALAFRAMARWGAGQVGSARADLAEVEKLAPPAPKGTEAVEVLVNLDLIQACLALREARALMNPPASVRP